MKVLVAAILVAVRLFLPGLQDAILENDSGTVFLDAAPCANGHFAYKLVFVPGDYPDPGVTIIAIWGVLLPRGGGEWAKAPIVAVEFDPQSPDTTDSWYADLDLDGYADYETDSYEELIERVGPSVCDTIDRVLPRGGGSG